MTNHERERAPKNTKLFTDMGIRRLRPLKTRQTLYWDTAQKGLALLVSPGGTKTFRSQYKLHGEWKTRSIGRFGELVPDADPDQENINIGEARKTVANDRALAKKGVDPKAENNGQPASKESFEAIVDRFITEYAKPRQRTWDQTQRILKKNCKNWLKRDIDSITKHDARALLRGFIAEGHGPKAGITRAWLKKLWRWAYEEDLVASPIMEAVKIDYVKNKRKRVYSDDELKAIWQAADKLPPSEGAYIKLMILLVLRKTALGGLRWADVTKRKIKVTDADGRSIEQELDLLITPPERVKQSKRAEQKHEPREYLTPLPPLALRILKSLPRHDDRVFSGLSVSHTKLSGRPSLQGRRLMRKLAKLGGPKYLEDHADYHAFRHTLSTWLQNEGHSKEERGLVLEHKETGVTAGYSHGLALRLKYMLLCKWADHVNRLVTPEGTVRLRG